MPASFFSTAALAYYLSFSLLLVMAGFVVRRDVHSWLHRCFALTALSLLAWIGTLFLYERTSDPTLLLWLGRLNFAAIVFTVYMAYLLVHAVAGRHVPQHLWALGLAETVLLAIVTATTPAVDKMELVSPGMMHAAGLATHSTVFGPFAVVYFAHVLAYLAVAVLLAFRLRSDRGLREPVRDQLLLIGGGMLATGAVAVITNVLLPFSFSNFRYDDLGPLSTILFMIAVAYAVVRHHLFDIRVFIRRTFVWGIVLSLAMAVYSAMILLATDHFAGDAGSGFVRFGVLFIAGSVDPLRRLLEHRIDRLLFPNEEAHRPRRNTASS